MKKAARRVCVGLNVYIDLMTANVSMGPRKVRKQAADVNASTSILFESNGDGSRPPVVRSVRSSTDEGPLALNLQQAGLGSNISSCEVRPP